MHYVLTLKGSDKSVAEKIIAQTSNKDQKILEFDDMRTTNLINATLGATYLQTTEQNLEVLRTALSSE